jgi:phosphotransferase system HPr (HPr) family protein
MPELRITVIDPAGLHARPAAKFVQAASRFSSAISIGHGDRFVDAKSLMALLSLGVRPGSQVVLRAEGEDASGALSALATELAPYVEPVAGHQDGRETA